MGALGSSLTPDVLRVFASASLTSSYQLIQSVFSYPVRIMKITSTSSTDVTVSWNGVDDHEYIVAGSFLLIDVSANREASQICEIAKGTSILIKGTAGTGNIYVSTYVVKFP